MEQACRVICVWLAVGLSQEAPRESIPFTLVTDHLIAVRGEIGGLHGLNLIVDTGTARTVVDERVARHLGLALQTATVEVFGTPVAAHRATVATLTSGFIRTVNLDVLVVDLGPHHRRFGVRIDALLGVDVLRGKCLTIDYAARRLLADCSTPLPSRTPFNPPLPVVDATIDGHSYRLLADTGSQAIAIFRTSIPPAARIKEDGKASSTHLTGTADLPRFTPREFRVTGYSIGKPPVFIIETDQRSLGYDGVLGTRWLTATELRFDMVTGVVSWRAARER